MPSPIFTFFSHFSFLTFIIFVLLLFILLSFVFCKCFFSISSSFLICIIIFLHFSLCLSVLFFSVFCLSRTLVTNTVNLTPISNKRETVLYAQVQLGVKSGRKLKKMKVITLVRENASIKMKTRKY